MQIGPQSDLQTIYSMNRPRRTCSTSSGTGKTWLSPGARPGMEAHLVALTHGAWLGSAQKNYRGQELESGALQASRQVKAEPRCADPTFLSQVIRYRHCFVTHWCLAQMLVCDLQSLPATKPVEHVFNVKGHFGVVQFL